MSFRNQVDDSLTMLANSHPFGSNSFHHENPPISINGMLCAAAVPCFLYRIP